ncbi:hypothetical protein IE81DRAFT_257025 [Ceraceosorus guamensis]|uniref:Uncharacterized protein n=1 Tax=Ceraceosorus guamensis TaxID=1522189 RepID=A0A316VRG8_9BASI|nr:hypothetical protein IE81DRAFT_257025 [Ceraceosorus guamensis]PWN39814.1 hypothetical protein IE81DRAFT_257025 [Ceraceosorus guamensis]
MAPAQSRPTLTMTRNIEFHPSARLSSSSMQQRLRIVPRRAALALPRLFPFSHLLGFLIQILDCDLQDSGVLRPYGLPMYP